MWKECTDRHEHTYSICEGNPSCPKIHLYWEPVLPRVIIQLGFSQRFRWGKHMRERIKKWDYFEPLNHVTIRIIFTTFFLSWNFLDKWYSKWFHFCVECFSPCLFIINMSCRDYLVVIKFIKKIYLSHSNFIINSQESCSSIAWHLLISRMETSRIQIPPSPTIELSKKKRKNEYKNSGNLWFYNLFTALILISFT